MHVNKGKTIAQCLTERTDYAKNPDKTEDGEYISAYACDAKTADSEFLLSKRQYRQLTGREQASDVIAYQIRQSFKPGEVTPEEANRLGYEFARRFTKGDHAFIVCTHTDKQHIHNHIIWNSTTLDCTRKFRNFWGSTEAVRKLSDLVCMEHRLSVIENPKPYSKSYNKWLGGKAKPCQRDLLRAAIDAALAKKPKDFETFLKLVEAAGYTGDTILSLEDMLAICEKAKADGKLGFIYRGDSQNNLVVDFLPILLSYGGWVIDSNNQPTVNTPEFKDAMNFYLKLIATGSAQVKDDLIASCDTGAGTMGVGWPGWYTPTADTAADYCAITGAVAKGGETHNANVYGVWTIGIPNNSQNKELATELLSYLMDKDVQKSTVPSGGVPCRYSSLQDAEILKTYPQYEVVCKALEGGMYRPVIAEWTQFYTILGAEMDNIVNGVKTVDQGLADAQTQLEALMK